MAAKKESVSYFSLCDEVKKGVFRPVYLLCGEEPYYIDKLQELIINTALTEDERDFNLTITYGADCDVKQLISVCKQYPAMAARQVVVLREAQALYNVDDLDLFTFYVKNVMKTTVLVICYKGGMRKNSELYKLLKADNTFAVLETVKYRDYEIPKSIIPAYVRQIGCNIDPKANSMLAEYVGTDLSRLYGEIDKLKLLVGPDNKITPELIEKNIGISKDYNYFELEDAIINKNALKAFTIINYFKKNPKGNEVIGTVAMLFSFFSSLLLACTSPDKSVEGIKKHVGTNSDFRAKKLQNATEHYTAASCVNIISYLRECDTKCKGIKSRQDSFALEHDLIYKILHS